MLDPKDKQGWQKDALSCPVKYTRIIKRDRWYAQLVMEGAPTKDRSTGDGVVGLEYKAIDDCNIFIKAGKPF